MHTIFTTPDIHKVHSNIQAYLHTYTNNLKCIAVVGNATERVLQISFFLCRYHCYIREILKAQLKGQFYTKKMFRVAILVHNFYKTP